MDRHCGQKFPGAGAASPAGMLAAGIGAVERHRSSPLFIEAVGRVRRFAAPIIVSLKRCDTGLKEKIGTPFVLPDDEDDVALFAAECAGQLGQIHAAQPFMRIVRPRGQCIGHLPVALDQAGHRVGYRHGLLHPR